MPDGHLQIFKSPTSPSSKTTKQTLNKDDVDLDF